MKKVRTRKTGMQELTIAWMIFAVLFLGVFIRPVNVQAAKVKLNKSTVTIYRGASTSLKVSGSKKKVKWSSSKKSVVSVSSGKLKGKKAGTAYIYAKVGKRTLKCKVIVKELDKAIEQLEKAVEIFPDFEEHVIKLGGFSKYGAVKYRDTVKHGGIQFHRSPGDIRINGTPFIVQHIFQTLSRLISKFIFRKTLHRYTVSAFQLLHRLSLRNLEQNKRRRHCTIYEGLHHTKPPPEKSSPPKPP